MAPNKSGGILERSEGLCSHCGLLVHQLFQARVISGFPTTGAKPAQALEKALRRHVGEQVYGSTEVRGRGRCLGFVKVERPMGRPPSLYLRKDISDATQRWLEHLVKLGMESEEALRQHLQDSLPFPVPAPPEPDPFREWVEPLVQGFRGVLPQFRRAARAREKLRRRPGPKAARAVERAVASATNKSRTRTVLASLAGVTVKSVERAEQLGWPDRLVDHEGVGAPPGTTRLHVDLNEYNDPKHKAD